MNGMTYLYSPCAICNPRGLSPSDIVPFGCVGHSEPTTTPVIVPCECAALRAKLAEAEKRTETALRVLDVDRAEKRDLEKRLADAEERENGLRKALEFYATPETYLAIGFLPDPPCGEFIDDFSETDLGERPGKLARKALGL